MTDKKKNLLLMKGAISELQPDEQAQVKDAADRLRSIARESNYSLMAMGLVCLELAVEGVRVA